MVKKLPFIAFYIGDWLKDDQISRCSPATRGIWIDLLFAMHERNRSGELRGTTEELARIARCWPTEFEAALTELQKTQAANVENRNGSWQIANRRMKREAVTREKKAAAGSKGGANKKQNRNRPDTEDDNECLRIIEEFCISLGLPRSDGEAMFHKWEANGWTNTGKPILDWQATIRSWKAQGYMPSQKHQSTPNGTKPMSIFEIDKRIEAVNDAINVIFRDPKNFVPEARQYQSDQKLKNLLPEPRAKVAELGAKKEQLKRKKLE